MRYRCRHLALLAQIGLVLLIAGCAAGDREAPDKAGTEPTEPLALAPTGPGTLVEVPEVDGADLVQRYSDLLHAGELDALYEQFSPDLREEMSLDRLRQTYDDLRVFGSEVEVVDIQARRKGAYRGFARSARYDRHDGIVQVMWTLRDDDTIAGLIVRRAAAAAPAGGG